MPDTLLFTALSILGTFNRIKNCSLNNFVTVKNCMNRNSNLNRLQNEEFDICIIGGGASGAGCALDAALRGFKVALIEKEDFASETTSKSTKLIHGGVRYLEQAFKNLDFAQLKQVQHGLAERHNVIKNAPHLAHPLALMTPVYSWFEAIYFTIGLKLYSWFAKNDPLPKSKWLSKKETFGRIPGLSKKVHSSVLYYDGQLDDARYCLALAHSADEAGAAVVNHAQIVDFQRNTEGVIISATVEETECIPSLRNTTVKAKLFINCTGAGADHIRLMANPEKTKRIRPSKGVHLVLPYHVLGSETALMIPKTPDGRVIFAIPFEGQLLLGTTDADYKTPDVEPTLNDAEIDFLLETLEPYLENKVNKSDIKSGFGGLRPLIMAEDRTNTKSILRDHEVETDKKTGLISLLGGKWTTYRVMAQDTIDHAAELLRGSKGGCKTADHKLVGAQNFDKNGYQALQKTYNLPEDVARHLNQKYGSRASKVADLIKKDADLSEKLTPQYPHIKVEVVYCATEEMACSVRDFVARRTRLELMDWEAALAVTPEVARLMGSVLGWTEAKTASETTHYSTLIRQFKALNP